MQVPATIFREYDVRGDAERHLRDDLFHALGRVFRARLKVPNDRRARVALGRDCRLSSPRLHAALLDGLLRGGVDVIDIGVGPTPLLYFAVHALEGDLACDGGLMITGSHNPGHENGVKMLRRTGSIYGEEIQAIRAAIEGERFTDGPRGEVRVHDVQPSYVAFMKENIHLATRDVPLVVDAGNGSAGPLALASMRALGLDPVPLFCEMDGHFPNHHPDPTQPENVHGLIAQVKERRARVGIAYDGDGDRIGAIDEDGSIVWGDRLLTLFARDILREKKGAAILGEVKCSQTLYDDIAAHGGRPIVWKTGHSLIKTKMKEEHALLAGEMSGHLFFADRYFGFDDAIYGSLRLVEILARTGRSIGALLADLPHTYVTPEIRVDCDDATKFAVVDEVKKHFVARIGSAGEHAPKQVVDIDGARILFPHGWGLVRASNTQPALVVRFEADTEARRDAYRSIVEEAIAKARANWR